MRRLITVPLSHYCERARWALDHTRVAYREERHLQIFHAWAVRRAGGRRTVPVLVDGSKVFDDSADIVAHADSLGVNKLYPEGVDRTEVEALERDYAGELGVETRRLAYSWFMDLPRRFLRYNNAGTPLYQRAAITVGFRFARERLTRYMKIYPPQLERGREIIARALDAVAERLDGGDYLCGGQFTAADLTFAAMIAPVLLPARYGVELPPIDTLAADRRRRVEDYRAHPAGAFALEIYRRHR